MIDKTPDVKEIKHGWVQFSEIVGGLYYVIISWHDIGVGYTITHQGFVEDEKHLARLKTIKNVREMEN